MCKEKLNEIALNVLNESDEYGEMTNLEILKVNVLNSTISCRADYSAFGEMINRFYVITFNKNIISGESYEEIYNNLINIDNLTAEVIWQSRLQPEISEELFNEFCNYITSF